MRAEDQLTEKDGRLSRLLRRALLVVGGAIAAAVVTSAPAWADVVDNGVAATTTVVDSVTKLTRADELPSRVLDVEPDLVPISLDAGLALVHEFVPELPVVSPAEVRHSEVTAPVSSRLDLNSGHAGPPASSTPVLRFSTEPVSPAPATSDAIASGVASTLPWSSITNGQGNDSSTVVPRRGELAGTCHATRMTETGQPPCRTWTPVVRVMSVLVGKQPGRTPD